MLIMKQRFAAANEYSVAIRTRGTARNRGSDKPCDAKKIKRVRFDDNENVSDYASVRERKSSQFPRSDAPKTSEYAYFMNAKCGAVHGHSCSYDRGNVQLKKSETNRHGREDIKTSNKPKTSSKDLRSSDCRKRADRFDHHHLLTPPATNYEEPSQGAIKDLTKNIRERPLSVSENVTPVGRNFSLSTFREASENAGFSGDLIQQLLFTVLGKQCKEKGIFSAKRQRLRQWGRNSISEVEKLHPEGFGFMSSLLGRLYHKCDESDLFYIHDSSKGETGSGCKAPISCEFKNLEERQHVSHRREWDMEPPKICLGGYSDRVFLEQDAYFSGFPFTDYGTEARFKDDLTDLHLSSKVHKSRHSHVEHDLSFCLPFERYGYSNSHYVEELDGSCTPIECQRKDPHRFLLEWDFEREKYGVISSIINHESAKIYSPGLPTTWNVNHQQIVDLVPDAKALCSPSLFSNYYLQYNSIQSYPSTSYFTPDLVPNFDKAKCSSPRTDMSSLTFPSTPKCITLTEDTNAETIPYGSDVIFPLGDQLWLKNKAWDSKPHSDCRQKSFQDADLSPKNPSFFHTWQFPQIEDISCSFSIPKEAPTNTFSPCSEDTIHNHSWLLNFSSSLDSTVSRPLLLDNVSNDWSNREVYFDDDDKRNYIVDVIP